MKAVKITNGESNRIRRDCVSRPFSEQLSVVTAFEIRAAIPNIIKPAPMAAVLVRHPAALRVRNIVGIVMTPIKAGKSRMAT